MPEPAKKLTAAQKKAVAFLKRPKPSLDDWWRGQCEAEAVAALKNPQLGQIMPDGTVFSGITPDGKRIFAMPEDLNVTMTFNEAAKRVKELNAQNSYGYNDWMIPGLTVLHILCENKDQGALANTFETAVSGNNIRLGYPYWYWSSTQDPINSNRVRSVRFLDAIGDWDDKDKYRLGCRPVRLMSVPKT